MKQRDLYTPIEHYYVLTALYGRLVGSPEIRQEDRNAVGLRGHAGLDSACVWGHPDAVRAIGAALCTNRDSSPCPTCLEAAHRFLAVEDNREIVAELMLWVGVHKARQTTTIQAEVRKV